MWMRGLINLGTASCDYMECVEAGVHGIGLTGVYHEEHLIVANDLSVSLGGFHWKVEGKNPREHTVSSPTSARKLPRAPNSQSPRYLGTSGIHYPHSPSCRLKHCVPHHCQVFFNCGTSSPADPSKALGNSQLWLRIFYNQPQYYHRTDPEHGQHCCRQCRGMHCAGCRRCCQAAWE